MSPIPSTIAFIVFDYDLESGTISNERKLIDFDRSLGVPDGSHIDVEGRLVVAMAFGESNVLVVDPGTNEEGSGKIIGQIDVDAQMVTCATFGGSDMKDLYITSASVEKMVPGINENDKNHGNVFKTRAPAPGMVRPKFGPVATTSTNAVYKHLPVAKYRLGGLLKNAAP